MKNKVHIPDDPTVDNIKPFLDALKYNGEITLKMMEAEANAFLLRRSSRTLRALGKHLREHFAGCFVRIEYPPSKGRNGFIRLTMNRLFDGFAVPVCQISLRVAGRVEPMFGGRWNKASDGALRQLQDKLVKEGADYQAMLREAGIDRKRTDEQQPTIMP